MLDFYDLALMARRMNIPCENEPNVFKQEAWKYAKMFGDNYIHTYKSFFGN